MQFIPLANFYQALRGETSRATNKQFTDTTLTPRNYHASNKSIFNDSSGTSTTTSPTTFCPFFYPVSLEGEIPFNTYQVTPVGTTSQQGGSMTNGYYTAIIITASANTTITHLVAAKKMYYTSSSTSEAILFALKLDKPVTLNTGESANFVFAIEF